jgi:hypothetical protein
MKKIVYILGLISIVLSSCLVSRTGDKMICNETTLPYFYIRFKDPEYKVKYPIDSIKIMVIDKITGKIENGHIIHSNSFNTLHSIGIDNLIDSNKVIKLSILNHEFVYTNFKIKKVKIETLFGGYNHDCLIDSFIMNGKQYPCLYCNAFNFDSGF